MEYVKGMRDQIFQLEYERVSDIPFDCSLESVEFQPHFDCSEFVQTVLAESEFQQEGVGLAWGVHPLVRSTPYPQVTGFNKTLCVNSLRKLFAEELP